MGNSFLKRFITGERYLQNPPLETNAFIALCKTRGIETNKQELEFFEKEKLLFPIIRMERPIIEEERIEFTKKDRRKCWRLAKDGLQAGEIEIQRYKVQYYSNYDLLKPYYLNALSNLLREGQLFDPSTRPFQNWESFKCKKLEYENERIVSFYSSFQVYWLEKLKKSFSFEINFATTTAIESYIDRLKEFLDVKKRQLAKEYEDFNRFLKFLLLIQSAYYPYAKSGSGEITIWGDLEKWSESERELDLQKELDFLNLRIDDIVKWYKILSREAQIILGIKRDDWVQLWKNIFWNKKDGLEGNVRLGVEYLQWAVMFKKVIGKYLQREVHDIDEVTDVSADDVLRYDPSKINQSGVSSRAMRAIRNRKYYDPTENKNYYYDRYKRLFYLANTFGIDYQPRIMVFVEGETEESILPKVFEWYHSKPEDIGIEIVNLKGINKLFGQGVYIRGSQNNKCRKIFLNNFNRLISYNLNKWQTIPFFVGDDEGNIRSLLKSGISINFEGGQYAFPEEWRFLWGIDNGNQPFVGKDFELANFSNQEIATVLTSVLEIEVAENQIQGLRNGKRGIKDINASVDTKKITIAENLINNLLNNYIKSKDNSPLERPIFKVIEKVFDLAALNHQPGHREIELKNKEIIRGILCKLPGTS